MLIRRFLGRWLVVAAFAVGIMMAVPAIPAMAQQNQPNMQAAMRSLQQARNSLNAASANKGGHRRNAISLVDRAINEVRAGMDYARKHPGNNNGRKGYPAGHGTRVY